MKNILANWKTSSAGILAILGAVVHLVFHIKDGTADESVWKNDLAIIVLGIGAMAAGDSTTSAKETQKVADAVVTGDTKILRKSEDK